MPRTPLDARPPRIPPPPTGITPLRPPASPATPPSAPPATAPTPPMAPTPPPTPPPGDVPGNPGPPGSGVWGPPGPCGIPGSLGGFGIPGSVGGCGCGIPGGGRSTGGSLGCLGGLPGGMLGGVGRGTARGHVGGGRRWGVRLRVVAVGPGRRGRGRRLAVDPREDRGLSGVVVRQRRHRLVGLGLAVAVLVPELVVLGLPVALGAGVGEVRRLLRRLGTGMLRKLVAGVLRLAHGVRSVPEGPGSVAHLVGAVAHLLGGVAERRAGRLGALTAEPVVGADLARTSLELTGQPAEQALARRPLLAGAVEGSVVRARDVGGEPPLIGSEHGQSSSELLPGSAHVLGAENFGAMHESACVTFRVRSACAVSSTWVTFL